MKRCCVIGGAGFIGRRVVDVLQQSGRQISVIGRSTTLQRSLPGGVDYYAGDIADSAFIVEHFKGVDEVIDLAYSSVPQTSYEDPVKDITNNLSANVGMFELACEAKVKKMVFISSGGTVYGEPDQLPISETHATNPISPYGITKLALEKYAFLFHRNRELPILCVRPSNPFGEGQLPFVGQGFVATAMASVISGKEITIFGERGTIRDYIYVDDLARGIVAALDFGQAGECYNIGSGIGRDNLEVISAITKVSREAGFSPRIRHQPERSFDVGANVLDSSKLRNASGWQPISNFDESIRRTFAWYLNNKSYGNQ